jgi:hypothetical protein
VLGDLFFIDFFHDPKYKSPELCPAHAVPHFAGPSGLSSVRTFNSMTPNYGLIPPNPIIKLN